METPSEHLRGKAWPAGVNVGSCVSRSCFFLGNPRPRVRPWPTLCGGLSSSYLPLPTSSESGSLQAAGDGVARHWGSSDPGRPQTGCGLGRDGDVGCCFQVLRCTSP